MKTINEKALIIKSNPVVYPQPNKRNYNPQTQY